MDEAARWWPLGRKFITIICASCGEVVVENLEMTFLTSRGFWVAVARCKTCGRHNAVSLDLRQRKQ
jgi:hypothetical protein